MYIAIVLVSSIMMMMVFVFVIRLTGYENALLGYRPRIYTSIKSLLKEDKSAIDVLMFGKQ